MNTSEKTIDRKKIHPFIPFSKEFSQDFKKICKKLLFLIHLNNMDYTEELLNRNDRFLGYVYKNWKEAQTVIIDRIIENFEQINILQKKVKTLKKSNGIKVIKYNLRYLKIENLVMRRMIDAIVWKILKDDYSAIRRLSTKGGQNNFSSKNIKDALSVIKKYNKTSSKIAICCDLTTFIHIGDILLLDLKTKKITFIELKSGGKNIFLSKLASESNEVKCKSFEKLVTEVLSEKENKHFLRLKKQDWVARTVINTINNEKGIDHNTEMLVKIHSTSPPENDYSARIIECYKQLQKDKAWAIDTIDDCLHIGVYNNNDHAFVGFNTWMDIIRCQSKIYNLANSFLIPHTKPFAALNLPRRILEKVITGKIIIILCLNIEAFVKLANSVFPDFLSYASKKETSQIEARIVPMKLGKTAVKSKNGFVGQGIADRILFDLQYPKHVIKVIKQIDEQA